MSSPSRARRAGAVPFLLGLIVVGAAALRLWGLTQGGPMLNGRPDEREMLENTAGFPAGDLNPRWLIYPNLFLYVTWLWTEGVLALQRLVGSVPDYATLVTTDMPRVILIGRVLSALAGAATVLVLYLAARRAGGRRLGLTAALLLATNFLHIRDSHAIKTEAFLALGILATIAVLARWAQQRTIGWAILSGIATGVTMGFKYNGLMLWFAAWVADLVSSPRRGLGRLWPSGQLVVIGATTLGGFLACSPYLLLDWPRTQETFAFVRMAIFANRPQPKPPPGETRVQAVVRNVAARAFGYHVTVSLRRGGGLLFALLVPVALVLAFRRPRAPLLVIAATFAAFYYVVIGASSVHLVRYLTPIVPLLALLVAHLLVVLADALPRRLRMPGLVVLCLLVVAEPVASAVAYDRIAARTDTRVLATRWMAEHLGDGSKVAQLGTLVFPLADPELPAGVARAELKLGEKDFRGRGITHVVTHEHWLVFSRLIVAQMDAIRPHLRLLATFSPYRSQPGGSFEAEDAYYIPFWDFDAIERPGPLVHIYAWDEPPAELVGPPAPPS